MDLRRNLWVTYVDKRLSFAYRCPDAGISTWVPKPQDLQYSCSVSDIGSWTRSKSALGILSLRVTAW